MRQITIQENGITLVFGVSENNSVSLLHCQTTPYRQEQIRPDQIDWFRAVEIQLAGEDQDDHHGSKYTGTLPGHRLTFLDCVDERNAQGRKITIVQKDAKTHLVVKNHFQFTDGIKVIESFTTVHNEGKQPQTLTYVSSFVLAGLTKSAFSNWEKAASLWIPSNCWCGEFQWRKYTLPELGLSKVGAFSTKRLSYSSIGTWTSHEYLPMGYVENEESREGWYFSILHNGPWHWEVSDTKDALYLQISGPTENESHFSCLLTQDSTFESVHAAVAVTASGFENAVCEMTKYRRAVRRSNEDNRNLPVIFNDFMNCLEGDPTAQKEYPLIDAAAAVGCEYFTMMQDGMHRAAIGGQKSVNGCRVMIVFRMESNPCLMRLAKKE